ncbi:MAG: tRNA guanosine(34) transglycosylase Tgt [Bradymonadales bacterium]|nr:MAG: tRNA guanosine(34) transglycosylase Tgt [Bradymonadales bacterium]
MSFEILKSDPQSCARRGRLQCAHGPIETPVFMPVGTYGAIRALSSWEVEELGAEVILANNYHLSSRPGLETIESLGGLHSFLGWKRNLLTDSGGFQVFSLAKRRKLSDEGVEFQDHIDGRRIFLSPESVVQSQEVWGSDIMMVLDHCPAADLPRSEILEAMSRTLHWADRSLAAWSRPELHLFPIVQGACDSDLRERSLQDLMKLEEKHERKWPGVAIGGLSVGEEKEDFVRTLFELRDKLPFSKPHYLMGVGTPRDLVFGVLCGIDMFDCVIPSRNARHGIVMTETGRLNLFNQQFTRDEGPLDSSCPCRVCSSYSRAFLRHLFVMGEPLAARLATLHNVSYFLELFRKIRDLLESGDFYEFAQEFLKDPKNLYLGGESQFFDFPKDYRVSDL